MTLGMAGIAVRRRLGRLIRTIDGSLRPRALILMYHRVADLDFDPQLLAVTPRHFAEHLDVLRGSCHPITLTEVTDAATQMPRRRRRLPRRPVVLTLDDGYADNLVNARPLLERFDVPATAFITTGYLGGDREFWWDELERLVFDPLRLPAIVELLLDGSPGRWELDESTVQAVDADPRNQGWNIEESTDPGPRQRLYRALYEHLHSLTDAAKWELLGRLREIVGAEVGARASHRTLTSSELARLADGHLVEIGAHSVTHPSLVGLPAEVQAAEIVGSRHVLREKLGLPVASFAFPHGTYSDVTIAAVRQAGFTRACTSEATLVRDRPDPLRLPRVVPRDWDGETFARWLRDWLG